MGTPSKTLKIQKYEFRCEIGNNDRLDKVVCLRDSYKTPHCTIRSSLLLKTHTINAAESKILKVRYLCVQNFEKLLASIFREPSS